MNSSRTTESAAARSRHQTEMKLTEAIERLQSAGTKVSISAVAREADVTPALVHNTYPDIAERIRSLVGKNTRAQRDAKHDALILEKARNRELRAEVDLLRAERAKLASLNLTLLSKLAVLGELGNGNVVSFMHPEYKRE